MVTVGNGENGLLGRVFLAGSYLAVAATFPLSLLLCFKVRQGFLLLSVCQFVLITRFDGLPG